MTDEAKLIIAGLRYCTTHDLCDGCPAKHICIDADTLIETLAAEVIEALCAELEQVEQQRDGLSIMLTNAESAVETLNRKCDSITKTNRQIIENYVPVRRGTWKPTDPVNGGRERLCDQCGYDTLEPSKFCPRCGALMRAEWPMPKEESPDEIPR